MRAFQFSLPRCCRSISKQLSPQFHFVAFNRRQHAHRTIAVTMQQAQKLSLCSQTKQCPVIVHAVDDSLHVFIIHTNLKRNDSLATCRQKNFGWKDFNEQLSPLEAELVISQR